MVVETLDMSTRPNVPEDRLVLYVLKGRASPLLRLQSSMPK